ncbi:hypothetical protein V3C99_018403, partial [Haemonchus contortus]
ESQSNIPKFFFHDTRKASIIILYERLYFDSLQPLYFDSLQLVFLCLVYKPTVQEQGGVLPICMSASVQ